MKRFVFLVLIMLSCMIRPSQAQHKSPSLKGEIRGKVLDAKTQKPIDYVSVTIERNGVVKAQVLTEDDGSYAAKQLDSGTYTIKVTNIGYRNAVVTNVEVHADEIAFVNVKMELNPNGTVLQDVVIVRQKPLIDPDGVNKNTKISKMIMALPQRNANSISNTVSGVDSRSGSTPNFRGARADGTAYYIDGVRVQGDNRSAPTTIPSDETYVKIKENQFKSTKVEPLSTFSVDVDKASYAIVRRYLNSQHLPPQDAVRIEEMINYFPYAIEKQSSEHPFSIRTEVATAPWDATHKLVHIVLKAPEIKMEKAPASNLVFLIDVSGSMMSADKLPLLKECMRLLTEQLRREDKVSIVVYAGAAGMVLEPTHGDEKDEILKAIETLSAGGSTAGGAGIELAYKTARKHFIKEGNNRIILATDGDFNVGVTSINDLTQLIEKERESGVFLSVLGFGAGNLKDETMETLADKGNGNYNYIDQILEGKKVLVNEMGGTLFTVAKDVKIQIEFNPNFVKSYRLLGYENRLLNNEDFNDDRKDAGEIGAGHCVTAIYELITKEETSPAKIDDLKYQQQQLTERAKGNELLTVKVRYKLPDENKSVKFEKTVLNTETPYTLASTEMRFALSVAMFGMKLRNSPFVKDVSYKQIIEMSKASKGIDDEGYRAEMIKLIETAQLLAAR